VACLNTEVLNQRSQVALSSSGSPDTSSWPNRRNEPELQVKMLLVDQPPKTAFTNGWTPLPKRRPRPNGSSSVDAKVMRCLGDEAGIMLSLSAYWSGALKKAPVLSRL